MSFNSTNVWDPWGKASYGLTECLAVGLDDFRFTIWIHLSAKRAVMEEQIDLRDHVQGLPTISIQKNGNADQKLVKPGKTKPAPEIASVHMLDQTLFSVDV